VPLLWYRGAVTPAGRRANGLLVLTCGTMDQVLRLSRPRTISDDEVAHGCTFPAAREKVAS
jgi:4-aminobutyrate aminotransferase-like enzyme